MAEATEPQAQIPDSERFDLDIPQISGPLRIDIARPVSMTDPAALAGPLPVIYVLDGDVAFGICAGVSRLMQVGGEVAPHLVVGVGYVGGEDLMQWTLRRLLDFTPPSVGVPPVFGAFEHAPTGGASAFLAAITERVVPEIERRFAAKPSERYLFGTSLGGFFAAHTLTVDQSCFAGIGIVSGAFLYGERQLLGRLVDEGANAFRPGMKVFVAAGSRENDPPMTALNLLGDTQTLIEGFKAKGVAFDGHVIEGETHQTVLAPAYARALRYFIPPPDRTPYDRGVVNEADH